MPDVKPVGKPDAVAPHVRFDERGEETEQRDGLRHRHLAKAVGNSYSPSPEATAPLLDSTFTSERQSPMLEAPRKLTISDALGKFSTPIWQCPLYGVVRSTPSTSPRRVIEDATRSGFSGACVKTHRPRLIKEQIPTAANSAQEWRLTQSSDLTSTSLDTTLLHSNKFGFERESLAAAADRLQRSHCL